MMFRWKLLATRLAILVLLAAAIWLSKDALINKWIVSMAEAELGSQVEIGRVHANLAEQKVFFKQLTFADPRDPMRNLFQADSAVLKLDWQGLSQRKFIVEEGSTSQLVFGSPRTNPGRINGHTMPVSPLQSKQEIAIDLVNKNSQETWLDYFKFSNQTLDREKLQLTSESKKIFRELDDNLNQHFVKIQEIKGAIQEINSVLRNYDNNVLRTRNLEGAKEKISVVGQDIDSIAKNLAQLDLQIASYATLLQNARQADEAAMIQNSPGRKIDGNMLSEILLSEEQRLHAQQAVYWYLAFRNAVPDLRFGQQDQHSNGKNVNLTGSELTPNFLVRKLNLDGEGRIAGQKFNFTGELKNYSLEPHHHPEPTTFQLRAQGNAHVLVDGIVDRRDQNQPHDSIQIICPDMPLPSRMLGSQDNLSLSISPCRSKIKIELQSTGDQLSGFLKFEYENLVTQIEHLDSMAGGKPAADRINLELGTINSYSVIANVGGTVQNPTIDFTSNLGTQLATKFNDVLSAEIGIAKEELEQLYENQKQRLFNEYAENIRKASEHLHQQLGRQHETLAADLETQMSGAIRR